MPNKHLDKLKAAAYWCCVINSNSLLLSDFKVNKIWWFDNNKIMFILCLSFCIHSNIQLWWMAWMTVSLLEKKCTNQCLLFNIVCNRSMAQRCTWYNFMVIVSYIWNLVALNRKIWLRGIIELNLQYITYLQSARFTI